MFRGLTSLVLLIVLGSASFFAYERFTERQALIARQAEELKEQERIIDRLTRSTRVAQAVVVKRWTEADGRVMSRVRFVELDEAGQELFRKDVIVEGETVYFDALVLKFDQELVGKADALKGRSVLLFRRIFGEHQRPSDGAPLDEGGVDGVPDIYRVDDEPSSIEVDWWTDFWKYANDPKTAEEAGVRVAQGEAPYTRMEEGKIYTLSLDHAGGLNIGASKVPAVLLDEDG